MISLHLRAYAVRMRAFLLVLAVVLLGPACSGERKGPAEPPKAPVRVAFSEVATVPIELSAIGTVEPSARVSLRPRVTGLVTAVKFQEGADVAVGDVLFLLDKRPFEVALREAESNLERSRTQAANAAAEAARYEELAKAGVATRQDAELRRAEARAAAAAVDAFQAATVARRLDLEYTTIRAPIAGRTGSILVREGNLVRANETVLVEIVRLAPAFVSFAIPEASVPTLQHAMSSSSGPLPVSAAAAPSGDAGAPSNGEHGTLSFIDSTIDRATGTLRLRATFENTSKTLWPGQFVQATVRLGVQEGAVVIPSEALQTGPSGTFVFVVGADETAEMRPVQPGERVAGGRIIVQSGLSGGERVVTDGQLRVQPGAKVTIVGEGPASPAGAAPAPGQEAR
ncbi:efflux RND transporter periplasmic adaptor subunit [Polyangium sp. y55x31]|uniref:efflux RND transporter periplasmic adaptor subunit n=1 Tax=Polyangium sp. y55x31 TaxID=3042688 RepID=UPI00248268F5|nr:efflux RND transporter periplasmic adaptor subunit [Polyangium sp. y55x31]MDI1482530.1 efflux RND transporter periplasmic adaptor subunit [Polyangium sp. y55x31]